MERRRYSPLFARIARMAKNHSGLTWAELAYGIGLGSKPRAHGGFIERLRKGYVFTNPDHFFAMCRYAGINDKRAAAIWAREQLPDRFSHLRPYVGCTLRMFIPAVELSTRERKTQARVEKKIEKLANDMLLELLRAECPSAYDITD